MFENLNLENEYVTVIAQEKIIISWYNKGKGKIIEYGCNGLLGDVKVTIFSLTEAIRGKKTIRYDEAKFARGFSRILTNPKWFHDNETGERLIAHIKKMEDLEKELKSFLDERIASKNY